MPTLFTLAIFNVYFLLFDTPSVSIPDSLEWLLLYLLWLSLTFISVYLTLRLSRFPILSNGFYFIYSGYL